MLGKRARPRATPTRGKATRVRTALEHAQGEIAAILDADLEYAAGRPGDAVPLLEGDANAAFGVRAFDGYTSHSFLS